jgi:hypothetical protein
LPRGKQESTGSHGPMAQYFVPHHMCTRAALLEGDLHDMRARSPWGQPQVLKYSALAKAVKVIMHSSVN